MIAKSQITKTLQKARYRITDENHWCQGEHARNANGDYVFYRSENAVSWCAQGAVLRETQDDPFLRERCLDVLYENLSKSWQQHEFKVNDFNDASTHVEVLDLFNLAIRITSRSQNQILKKHCSEIETLSIGARERSGRGWKSSILRYKRCFVVSTGSRYAGSSG